MPTDDRIIDENLAERKSLFENFGGLSDITVQNMEWLYMLEQDTRHSLAIEGYFTSEDELEAVLSGKRSNLEVTNYFRTAQSIYDQALQYYRDHDLRLDLSLVRHIHSELFRNKDERRGQFRQGGIRILRAQVQPPEFDIEGYLHAALRLTMDDLDRMPILTALARAHALFESIHPYSDGNGRTGRILLNYLAISRGYPPIIIKGVQASEREQYYAALEAADAGFHEGFPQQITPEALSDRLARGNVGPLRRLLADGLLPRLERLIVHAVQSGAGLMPLSELAEQLGVQEPTLRKRIERGTLLSIKVGRYLYSHPSLALQGRLNPDVRILPTTSRTSGFSAQANTAELQQLIITLPDGATLDAGSVAQQGNSFLITPPAVPMVDQLLVYLGTKPRKYIGIQSRHMGVGMAALCVRWGSYLATLLDANAPLHPDLSANSAAQSMSFISQSEMRRMNIEVSYAISRLAGILHERGPSGLEDALTRAYLYLPMPQRAVQMNREGGRAIIESLALARQASPDRSVTEIPLEHADRAIANVLAYQGWRNTMIEDIHAGENSIHPLRPYQRRMRPRESSRLLHEVSSNFASYYFWSDTFFGDESRSSDLAHWPETPTALANSFLGALASSWSLTEASAPVTLQG